MTSNFKFISETSFRRNINTLLDAEKFVSILLRLMQQYCAEKAWKNGFGGYMKMMVIWKCLTTPH